MKGPIVKIIEQKIHNFQGGNDREDSIVACLEYLLPKISEIENDYLLKLIKIGTK